jgi:phosphatidylinositol alpha-mannosyltransferase
MKIGFVLDDSLDKTDGVQQYVTALGHWFRREGHEVHYLVGHTERSDLQHIHSLSRNVQVHFNQNRMSMPLPTRSRPIRELLAREQFDILHVQMPFSPFMAGKVIKYAPPKTAVIGTFHILPFSRMEARATRALGLVLRRRIKRFDHVVSVSEPAAQFAKKSFRVKSEVLPNAVNVGAFVAGKRLRKFSDGKVTMVYLGRLVERKGCLYFLKALDKLHKEHLLHNARAIIAGKGPLEAKLKKFVADHRLGKIVYFVGYVSEKEKPNYLASADIAVLPSTGGESFGIVLVEAMAAGAEVVIAGNNRGYRSVMGQHADQLVNPADTKAFAHTLKHFIISVPARKRAKKWQAAAVGAYDVRTVGGRLLQIYEQALRKRSSHPKS